MIVAIVGSRGYQDPHAVIDFVEKLARKYPDAIVVSGGARGPDRIAENTAFHHGLQTISYRVKGNPDSPEALRLSLGQQRVLSPPSSLSSFTIETVPIGEEAERVVEKTHRRISSPVFGSFGAAAYFRNGWIVEDCDRLVAFWDGESRGTKVAISLALAAGKPVHQPAGFARKPNTTDLASVTDILSRKV